MFSLFRYSKRITTQNIIQTKQLLFLQFAERTHNFCNLVGTKDSYTVNYLINSCGLSLEKAKSASKKVKFENSQRPDSVIKLLKNYGFKETQISLFARKYPEILSYDPEKALLPKLEYFKSIGVYDIGKVLSRNGYFLKASLEKQMIPTFDFILSVIGCPRKMGTIMERSSWVFYSKNVVQNITLLRELEVPASNIELLLNHHLLCIIQNHEVFRAAVEKVKEMGFNPLKSTFVIALRVLSAKYNEEIWGRCSKEYKKWGWSEEDILSAFKKQPTCMTVSEKKIERTMGYLVDNFGFEPKAIANYPAVLGFNLEKRIIPRCSVIQVLSKKGLIKKVCLGTIIFPSEKLFLERFVTKYENKVPELMTIYQKVPTL